MGKYAIDRSESSWKKDKAMQQVMHDLGSNATIRGDEIEVSNSYYESKVVQILEHAGVKYSKK